MRGYIESKKAVLSGRTRYKRGLVVRLRSLVAHNENEGKKNYGGPVSRPNSSLFARIKPYASLDIGRVWRIRTCRYSDEEAFKHEHVLTCDEPTRYNVEQPSLWIHDSQLSEPSTAQAKEGACPNMRLEGVMRTSTVARPRISPSNAFDPRPNRHLIQRYKLCPLFTAVESRSYKTFIWLYLSQAGEEPRPDDGSAFTEMLLSHLNGKETADIP
jgi:hypothetical protein